MNLLKTTATTNSHLGIPFSKFKTEQYSRIEYFMDLCLNYISKQNDNYLTKSEIIITPEIKYEDIYGYRTNRVRVRIKDSAAPSGKKLFLSFKVPELIDDSFFYLNGSYYSPTCYILDKPISVKKKSIKIFGLFNSLTIFTKDKRAIFTGDNIPISYFLQLMIDNDKLKTKFESKFNIKRIQHKDSALLKYFSGLFNCDNTEEAIINSFNSLFLDDYTKELYKTCYPSLPDEYNIKDVISLSLEMSLSDDKPSFVDLSHKRLIFIEMLLNPIFRKCADTAIRAFKGLKVDAMEVDSDIIVKNFIMKLKHNFLYDIVNLYSGITTHKVSMMNPGSDRAPSSVSSLHETHYGRVCPITISNQDPGEVVSIVPGTRLNKLGLFLDEKGVPI